MMNKGVSEGISIADGNMADVDILLSLNKYVLDWHVVNYPDVFRDDAPNALREYFMHALENPNCYHYLAYDGADAVGFIQVEIRTSPGSPFRKPAKLLYINIIVVLPDQQGKGIGHLLVNRVQKLAEEQKVSRIELDHWEGNGAASHFFNKMGFEPYRHYLYKESC